MQKTNEPKKTSKDELKSGTGFMESLTDAIKKAEGKGYTKNLSAKLDHLECDMGKIKLFPKDFDVDKMKRFDVSSDPADQSAMYLISSKDQKIKGVFVESYGQGQTELSQEMLEKFMDHN